MIAVKKIIIPIDAVDLLPFLPFICFVSIVLYSPTSSTLFSISSLFLAFGDTFGTGDWACCGVLYPSDGLEISLGDLVPKSSMSILVDFWSSFSWLSNLSDFEKIDGDAKLNISNEFLFQNERNDDDGFIWIKYY